MAEDNFTGAEFLGNELPYSLEAEQTVLGALLLNPDVIPTAVIHLKPESFYREQHREIFTIILRMFSNGKTADIITVMNEAVEAGVFETSAMAKTYLKGIMESVPTVANIESYCKIVEEKYYIRALINASKEIIDTATGGDAEASQLLDLAEQKIYDIRQGKEIDGLTKISDIVFTAYDRIQKLSSEEKEQFQGARTGFSMLDNYTTGLNNSDLIIVAARPGMGKSAFALNIVANVCRRDLKKDVAVFSLEMGKEQLVTRMLSSEALVSNNVLRSGMVTQDDWLKLAEAADALSQMQIYIDDTAGVTVPQMKAKLRRMRNLGLVVIDYLQLMESPNRHTNRVTEVSEITRQLKLMAKELNVPVICLSQLSRSPESRQDHRPMLSDLRESGSIEQDADIILFLYRDAYYNQQSADQSVSECIVAKNRHGETGTVSLAWLGEYTLFRNLEINRT